MTDAVVYKFYSLRPLSTAANQQLAVSTGTIATVRLVLLPIVVYMLWFTKFGFVRHLALQLISLPFEQRRGMQAVHMPCALSYAQAFACMPGIIIH